MSETTPGGPDSPDPAGDPPPLPTPPPTPPSGATWQEWDVYLRIAAMLQDAELRRGQIEATRALAAAQDRTAAAIRDSIAAQNRLADAMSAPPPPWTPPSKAQLVHQLLPHMPQVTGLTDLSVVDLAAKAAETYLARVPTWK